MQAISSKQLLANVARAFRQVSRRRVRPFDVLISIQSTDCLCARRYPSLRADKQVVVQVPQVSTCSSLKTLNAVIAFLRKGMLNLMPLSAGTPPAFDVSLLEILVCPLSKGPLR